MRSRLRRPRGDAGSGAVELVASVPLLVLVTLVLVQGFLLASGVEAASKAARDAARVAADGSGGAREVAERHLPGWIRVTGVETVPGSCGTSSLPGVRSRVEVEVPFGVPGILEAGSWTRAAEACFPVEGR